MSAETHRNFIIAVISVACFAPIWMLLDRTPPYTGHQGEVVPAEPRAGEWMTVAWTVKVNRVCPGTIQREVVDAKRVVWNYDVQPAIRREQLTDENRLHRSFILPTGASPGPARYRARTCYRCNPLQAWWPICSWTPEIPFTIRPAAGPWPPAAPGGLLYTPSPGRLREARAP